MASSSSSSSSSCSYDGVSGFLMARNSVAKALDPLRKHAENLISSAKLILENNFPPKPPANRQSPQSFFSFDLSKVLLSPYPQRPIRNHCNRPLFASLSSGRIEREGKHLFDVALSTEEISQKLDGVPVYAVCNSSSEFVLVSDSSSQKSLGIFCFRRSDAEALLDQVKAREPLAGQGAKVVAVSLNKVYNLNAKGIAFRFLPDPQQVMNALQLSGNTKEKGVSFDGVPIFQSNNLIVRSKEVRLCPIFFCKEDLDQALQKASKLQNKANPSFQLDTEIQVGSFEHVVKRMEGIVDEEGWREVVFIPPGMATLGQLENMSRTTVG